MKKLFAIMLLAVSATQIKAQTRNIESAVLYFKNSEMEDAKKYIDLASENEETKNDGKMWYFRGRIYQKIFTDSLYRGLDPDAVEKATISFINCVELDKKKKWKEVVDDNTQMPVGSVVSLVNCCFACFNKAAELYEKKDYSGAIKFYDLILKAIPLDEGKDMAKNNLTENQVILYSSYAAVSNKDNVKARQYLQKLIDKGYSDPNVYIQMELLQLQDKDTSGALVTIGKGRGIFPENKDLMNEELRIYQSKGDMRILVEKLSKSIELEPENTNYLLTRGSIYDREKALFMETKKMREADSCANLAEADYKKCIQINPDDTIALYQLAALYMLKTNPIIEKLNALNEKKPDYAKKVNEYKLEIKALFEQARPHLEHAYQIKPDDYDIVNALYQLYYKLEMNVKAEELKKKKDSLKHK